MTGGSTGGRSLPHVRVHGRPYERGRQHGAACGDLIRRYPAVLRGVLALEAGWRGLVVTEPPSREELAARAMTFLPHYERFAPDLVEEMRGIADGAALPFADVLLVNVRGEVMGVDPARLAADGGCTAFAATSAFTGGTVLAGQNLDQDPRNADLLIVLEVKPNRGPAVLMLTFAGLVGYVGLNSAGLASFQNQLSTPGWDSGGMPHYLLKRRLLEQADVEGCARVADAARVCSSANYVLADRATVLDLEMAPGEVGQLRAADGLLVHANHFECVSLQPREALLPRLPDSACRAPRLADLLRAGGSGLAVVGAQTALADHEGAPASVCRHEPAVATIASLVAEPEHGRLHVAAGNPCERAYVTYTLG